MKTLKEQAREALEDVWGAVYGCAKKDCKLCRRHRRKKDLLAKIIESLPDEDD